MENGLHIDVFIVGRGANHRVRPATVTIPKTQTAICFRNLTGGAASLFFPGGFLAESSLELTAGSEACVDIRTPESGEYTYAVWVSESRDFAIGESSPRVNIDR
jgi:hypothetical protein